MYVILANNLSLVAACGLRWLGVDAAWPLRLADASAPATEAQEGVHNVLPLHAGVQQLWVVTDQGCGRKNHVSKVSIYCMNIFSFLFGIWCSRYRYSQH